MARIGSVFIIFSALALSVMALANESEDGSYDFSMGDAGPDAGPGFVPDPLLAACAETASHIFEVDGEVVKPCEALTGSGQIRTHNGHARRVQFTAIEQTGRVLTVLHSVGDLRAPIVRRVPQFRIESIQKVPTRSAACGDLSAPIRSEEAFVAKVDLNDEYAELCQMESTYLRVDDALGQNTRIIAVAADGLMSLTENRPSWISAPGAFTPEFRLIWRSSFRVGSTSPAASSSSVTSSSSSSANKSDAAKRREDRRKRREARREKNAKK